MKIDFQAPRKIARYNREVTVTEKIDGTNAAVVIQRRDGGVPGALMDADGFLYSADSNGNEALPGAVLDEFVISAQSRRRVIAPGKSHDNHGFAGWVRTNAQKLVDVLGEGTHFGEWYGRRIQRGYDVPEELGHGGRYFALFNVGRWGEHQAQLEAAVEGLTVVPTLDTYDTLAVQPWLNFLMRRLKNYGSRATGAEGYPDPEGVVLFHTHSYGLYKVTFEHDDVGKGYGS